MVGLGGHIHGQEHALFYVVRLLITVVVVSQRRIIGCRRPLSKLDDTPVTERVSEHCLVLINMQIVHKTCMPAKVRHARNNYCAPMLARPRTLIMTTVGHHSGWVQHTACLAVTEPACLLA